MHKCPSCKGSGSVEFTVTTIDASSNGNKPSEYKSTMRCLCCKGSGEVSDAVLKQIEYENSIMCNCGNPSGDCTYRPDNSRGAAVRKHHWVCNDCNKVYQIG